MVQLHLKPEIERRVRERLSAGMDANDLMEVALTAVAERDEVKDSIDAGWKQADAKDFVESDPESVIRRSSRK